MIKNRFISVIMALVMIPITLFILYPLLILTFITFGSSITSSNISSDEIALLQQSYFDGTLNCDYESAESFESALNSRIDVTNKIVSFEAINVAPDALAGFNIWAGEHLNFISKDAKDIFKNDQATVIVTNAIKIFGSWHIEYELIGVKSSNEMDGG